MPNAAALASEYAPRRQRPLAVTLTIVCIPLGGFLAGRSPADCAGARMARALHGRRVSSPMVAGVALLLRCCPNRRAFSPAGVIGGRNCATLLRGSGTSFRPTRTFVEPRPKAARRHARSDRRALRARAAPRHAGADRRVHLLPARHLHRLPLDSGDAHRPGSRVLAAFDASYALSLFNFGGVVGAIAGALVIQRLGSRIAMLGMSALAVASALVMAGHAAEPAAPSPPWRCSLVSGALLNAVQTTMFALAAHVFPTTIRGTGVGTTWRSAALGNVMASYVGSWALSAGGPPLYFSTWAAAMAIVFASLAIIRRHIPRNN